MYFGSKQMWFLKFGIGLVLFPQIKKIEFGPIFIYFFKKENNLNPLSIFMFM
jgi:hypothetical protein